ncbi:MAG: polysaccharide deacetylase family protein [Clostridium celatum]|nr:polysaccharide deacetylase family protein [Clostridium celatum]
MSIQNYLNQIKNAVFGKDVRQSIYDAIKQCYDDASIEHDNANMEVKLARGAHDTLNERLTSVEENIKNNSEQLAEMGNDKKHNTFSSYPAYEEPLISIIVDDGSRKYIDMFENVFESYGIKPTLAIVTSFVGKDGYLTAEELKVYQKKGYEIVGHSDTHSGDIYKDNGSISSVTTDLEKCYNFLKENGFNTDILVYPFGNFSNANFYKNIARNFFNIGVNSQAPNVINNKVPDTMYLERQFIQKNVYNLEQIKAKIDYAKDNKGWLILGLHTSETECDSNLLSEILSYIKLNNITIKNISDGFKIKGNRLSSGEYNDVRSLYINMLGEKNNGYNIIPWSISKTYGIDRKPASFANGLTYFDLHPDQNNGTPCSILNFKGDNDDFFFQLKKDWGTNVISVRSWNKTNGIWGDFNKLGFGDVETFSCTAQGDYTTHLRTNIKKINRVLNCNITFENSSKTGTFVHDLLLGTVEKEMHSSFVGLICPCTITTGTGEIKHGAVNIARNTESGKMQIKCHGNVDVNNVRWIDIQMSITE